MDQFDRMIAEAKAKGDPQFDPGYFPLAFSVFRGATGWVSWMMVAMQVALFIAAIWAGWHFYAATETLSAVKWGLSAATLVLVAMQMKLSLMPVMQANRVLLALRQMEQRLASRD